jgi:phosphoserine phosphatase
MNIIILISEEEISDKIIKDELEFTILKIIKKEFLKLKALYLYTNSVLSLEELHAIRNKLLSFKIDILQVEKLLNKNIESLIVFDMDSTLIKQEIIDELAKSIEVYSSVSHITEEAMQGKIDFETSLRKRCELLKGADATQFDYIYNEIHLNDGVKEFIKYSKDYLIKKVVLSGGFNPILKKFTLDNNFDNYKANELEVNNGRFSGNLIGEIIDKEKKAYYFNYYKNYYKISENQTIAVGDGSNDLLMIKEANIGLGFKPKEGLKKEILNWVDFSGMYFLYFLYE